MSYNLLLNIGDQTVDITLKPLTTETSTQQDVIQFGGHSYTIGCPHELKEIILQAFNEALEKKPKDLDDLKMCVKTNVSKVNVSPDITLAKLSKSEEFDNFSLIKKSFNFVIGIPGKITTTIKEKQQKANDERLKKIGFLILGNMRPSGSHCFHNPDIQDFGELKNDKRFVLEAVTINGHALQFASDALKNDEPVVLAALKREFAALRFASVELRNNKRFIFEAIKIAPLCMQYIGENLKKDGEFILEAYTVANFPIKLIARELYTDKNFLLKVIERQASAIINEHNEIMCKNDHEFLLECLDKNGYVLLVLTSYHIAPRGHIWDGPQPQKFEPTFDMKLTAINSMVRKLSNLDKSAQKRELDYIRTKDPSITNEVEIALRGNKIAKMPGDFVADFP